MQRLTITQRRDFDKGHSLRKLTSRQRSSRGAAGSVTAVPKLKLARENWRLDAHWTAVASYLAELHLPNEG